MSGPLWAILAILALASVLGILQIMASWVENEVRRTELRRRVQQIREERIKRLKQLEEAGVDVKSMTQHAEKSRKAA